MRKGMSQGLARPYYYDRNPVIKVFGDYSPNLAPHTLTTRWTYTVAAGKKAYLDQIRGSMIRQTAATAAGQVRQQINYTPSGASAISLIFRLQFSNTILEWQEDLQSNLGPLLAGDVIVSQDDDASTGGTSTVASGMKATEYDA